MSKAKEIIKTGLWQNNPALVQLLGMCPLMAVSTSVLNGLGLGLATTLVCESVSRKRTTAVGTVR